MEISDLLSYASVAIGGGFGLGVLVGLIKRGVNTVLSIFK